MSEAEDVVRARQRAAAASQAREAEIAASNEEARMRSLRDELRPMIQEALSTLAQAGYPNGHLLTVDDLTRQVGWLNKRYVAEEIAAWELFDNGYQGDTGWMRSVVYLGSNGKFVLPRQGLSSSPRSYYYYAAIDDVVYSNAERQIEFLSGARDGLRRLIAETA